MVLGSLQPCKHIPDKRGLLTDITLSRYALMSGHLAVRFPSRTISSAHESTLLNDTHRLPHARAPDKGALMHSLLHALKFMREPVLVRGRSVTLQTNNCQALLGRIPPALIY